MAGVEGEADHREQPQQADRNRDGHDSALTPGQAVHRQFPPCWPPTRIAIGSRVSAGFDTPSRIASMTLPA